MSCPEDAGKSIGVYGGFASHIGASIDLCLVADKKGYALEQLAVVADAVTTPYQACKEQIFSLAIML